MSESSKVTGTRVITDPAFNEQFASKQEEFFWCLRNPAILNAYAGQVVVVLERTILGHGPDSLEALQDARKKVAEKGWTMPSPGALLFVPIPATGTESVANGLLQEKQ